jgi:hypothetical protein
LYEGQFIMAQTTFTGPVKSTNGFIGSVTGAVTGAVTGGVTLPAYTVTSANAVTPKAIGQLIYVSNGLAGLPCIAVGNGTNWISPAGTAISAT